MRKDRLTQDLSTETLGRLFGASFALDQFRRDLEDLVSRCKEITAARQRGRHLFSRKAADEGVVQ